MRYLTDHKVNPANDRLDIEVVDEPGSGGANHLYIISGINATTNVSGGHLGPVGQSSPCCAVLFQNGPIAEVGVNGVTHEALLAVLADRLRCFQSGPYANTYNAKALEHIEAAMESLHARTRERMARGVEGTHAK